uniref:ATP-grasp domain-containing protein n=1 Tax=Chrysotila carterae TaxID=13221 RepID=A0A7S4C380_CHRCT|mmetsp:Transcript_42343/g.92804  ORF Transcript_42343/g.92804 Transcript_42343/m.92804 type:complete len:582 (-) Transcript_42343:697-2442(-)
MLNRTSAANSLKGDNLQSLTEAVRGAMTISSPTRKQLCIHFGARPIRQLIWYDPTSTDALDAMLRSACGLSPTEQYLLCEDGGAPVALSSSLPSGLTLHVSYVPKLATPSEVAIACDANIPTAGADAIVIIDPISTGAVLAHMAVHRNRVRVITVWSENVPVELRKFVAKGLGVPHAGVIQHKKGGIKETAAAVLALNIPVVAVLVGCETGVLLGDLLSEALQMPSNGTGKSGLRRNKFFQTEAIREAGLNACGQRLAHTREDVEKFLSASPDVNFKAVVKPVEGAGSDGVFICDSHAQVRKAFASLEGTKNVLGLDNYSVLLQEYLKGDEYVVDSVSRDGVHKCVAIWKYDKRVFNGAPVVYYGMRLMPIDSEPQLESMVRYTFSVLDTLGIKHGAMHSEIKLEERGPVVVEINCRLHGGEGTWAPMAEACLGYSAVSAALDAAVDPAAFSMLPTRPANFKAHAMEAKLRSSVEGILTRIDEDKWKEIISMSSFKTCMLTAVVGQPIVKTIDAVTASGNINLINEDPKKLEADYKRLHELADDLFEARPADERRSTMAERATAAERESVAAGSYEPPASG